MITWDDFEKIDIRTGTITKVEEFKKARKPSYKLWIDFGELGIKKSSAQITDHYSLKELLGQQIVAVVNFPPKQIADFISECLVLGAYTKEGSVNILKPSFKSDNGLKIG
ncbi:MAG: tRNA-binding protein [Bacteroidales bacterium]|jgi:tRNA-binding protein|nr:tRNA-binding protein [Bacteroidales bacterium]